MIDVNAISLGDVFSESSQFIAQGRTQDAVQFKHVGSGQIVSLGLSYITNFLISADQFTEVVKVGKEDKYWTEKQIAEAVRKGELPADNKITTDTVRLEGIRTRWQKIYGEKVFKVTFFKKDTKLSAKKYKELRDAQISEALAIIAKTATQKKGVEEAAKAQLQKIQDNPILDFTPGELRELRGYKLEFESRNGEYKVKDLDLPADDSQQGVRQVNINTIQSLIVDGVKYELE
jgi:hypothetical protein